MRFDVVLGGYDRQDVDALLQQVNDAVASTDPAKHAAAVEALRQPALRIRFRGYNRLAVDHHCRRLRIELAGEPEEVMLAEAAVEFSIVLRGYDMATVDALVQRAYIALASTDPARRVATRAALLDPTVPIALRGYDRFEVDEHLRQLASRLV